jgi:pectin methylesterase-like acyl-CoA thioesterase
MDYSISVQNAKGYIIESDQNVIVKGATSLDVAIKKVDLATVSGNIKGLNEEELSLLDIYFNAIEDKIYKPEVVITEDSYTVNLEQGVTYEVIAEGVNDYNIGITEYEGPTEDTVLDIEFTEKPLYKVNLDLEGLSDDEKAESAITFTNLNEEGYSYSFTGTDDISLRDGTYSLEVFSKSRLAQKLTSNLVVDGEDVEKTVEFYQATEWDFSSSDFTDEKSDFGAYNGLLFDGVKKNKTYALGSEEGTIKVPVTEDSKVTISYVYKASGTIGDVDFETDSGSTSTVETATYEYSGDEGYVDIVFSGSSYVTKIEVKPIVKYKKVITVGSGRKYNYKTINEALEAISCMDRPNDERVTVKIQPGNYEEMIVVTEPNISLVNASKRASTELKNSGVDIAKNAVRITSYYGHGCYYYSMGDDCKYDEEVLKVNKENGYLSYKNPGSGTTNGSYWNATATIYSEGFEADGIIFENSFNQYVSEKQANDIIELAPDNKGGERPTEYGDTSVQDKSYVERAAALALASGSDEAVFLNCRFVGRQDTLYGASDCKVVFYKCDAMGATDYIFGGMIGLFYQCNLVMNTSDNTNDVCYITAAQQSEGRGYLMYECTVTSTTPGKDTASTYRSKPGYFGRPWAGVTSEVVFYNTTIETTDYEGYEGQSLIVPEGWNSTLGGEAMCYEYGTIELAEDTDNSESRVSWSTVLEEPYLNDGTEITTDNWLLDEDEWNPLDKLVKCNKRSIIDIINDLIDNIINNK